jgi:hypothetical protein
MLKTLTLTMLAALLICSTAQAGQSSIRFAGGPGDSRANAVIIKGAPDSIVGSRAEYQYLTELFGQRNVAWRLFKQELSQTDDQTFEVLTIDLADGTRRVIYFDITGFFGKL